MNIPPTQPDCVWYFGCESNRTGHYAIPQPGEKGWSGDTHPTIKRWLESMDGRAHTETHDRWVTHWFECADGSQMTLIAKQDKRFDTRPGSWCGFLMPGNSPRPTALMVARETFPEMARLYPALFEIAR